MKRWLTEFLIEMKKNKVFLLFATMLILGIGSAVFVSNGGYGDQDAQTAKALRETEESFQYFALVLQVDMADASPTYKSLLKIQEAAAIARSGYKMKMEARLLDGKYDLTILRRDIYQTPDYHKIEHVLPRANQNELELAYYQALKDQGKKLSLNSDSFANYIAVFFSLLGLTWYLLAGFFSSDILLDTRENASIVRNLPLTPLQRYSIKILNNLLFQALAILLLLVCVVVSAHFFFEVDWTYPVPLFLGGYQTLAVWQFLLLVGAYLLCISLFAITVSLICHIFSLSFYAILLVHVLMVLAVYFTRSFSGYLPYLPIHYLNVADLAQGFSAELVQNSQIHLTNGFLVLTGYTGIIQLLVANQQGRDERGSKA